MLAKIKHILIIVNRGQLNQYKKLFPESKNLGLNLSFKEQNKPVGLPDAFLIGEKFIVHFISIIPFKCKFYTFTKVSLGFPF